MRNMNILYILVYHSYFDCLVATMFPYAVYFRVIVKEDVYMPTVVPF